MEDIFNQIANLVRPVQVKDKDAQALEVQKPTNDGFAEFEVVESKCRH